MGSLSKLFLDFHDENSLTKTYKEKITKGRDALRNKIGNKFEEKGRKKPQHCTQGSYAMKTAIMPLDGDEFDLDNGVYLRGYSTDQDDWPAAQTVHTWVKEAVEKHTSNSPIDKNTCIRVVYEDKYHIDLPIYIMGENSAGDSIAYLAHKSKGWIESDPKAFTAWFQGYVNENGQEIRRMVKYLKAWKDYKNIDIKGMAITILVCNNFSVTEKRDDLSLLDTVTNIIDSLEDSFHCYKPVTPTDEDLFADVSETSKNEILKGLNNLKKKLDAAINEKSNEKDATDILQKVFGERFPTGEDADKDIAESTAGPIKLGKSFKDSNGDGIGDLRGVAEKLDYLKDLGVDYLWLTPFFVSPQRDNGYDVADYRNIDPMFGTMEDLDNLIAEGEKRNIGLMFDMVFNHTSTSHEWFRRALAGEKNIRIIIYLRRGRRISPRQTGSQSLEVLHGNMYPLSENGICIYLM